MGKYINAIFIFYLGLFSVLPLTAQEQKNIPADIINHGETAFNNRLLIPAAALMIPDTFQLLPRVKQDFMVNELTGDYGAEQSYPAVAADSNGNYAVTWIDRRNGGEDIYIQFFNYDDEPIGSNIKVSDQSYDPYMHSSPLIAGNKKGDIVVVWKNPNQDWLLQKFSNTGIKIGSNIQVNNPGEVIYSNPALVVAEDGRFLVSWYGWNNQYNIFARIYNINGSQATDAILNDSTNQYGFGMSFQGAALDGLGNFVVVWLSVQNFSSSIYLQQLDLQGNKIGNNVKINDGLDSLLHTDPSITASDDGYFLIVWSIYDANGGTMARIYRSNGEVASEQLVISRNNYDWLYPQLSGNRKDTFWIFNDNSSYISSGMFKCCKISKSGEMQGGIFIGIINSADSLTTREISIANIVSNRFYLSYRQFRRMDNEIFVQKYDLNWLPLNVPVKADIDPFGAWQINPLVCFNQQGSSIVLWEDQRNGRRDLYAQVYDLDFNPLGENIQINDISADYWYLEDKKAGALSDGTFVIAFCGTQSVNYRYIYFQFVDAQGYKIKNNKLIKEYYDVEYNLELKIDRQDQILLCWYDKRSAYVQKYDKNLDALSPEKKLYSNTSQNYYQTTALSINKDLNIFLTWRSYNEQNYTQGTTLNGLLYDQTGTVISDILTIDRLSSGTYIQTLDNYITDAGDYIVSWIYNNRVNIWRMYTTDQQYTFRNSFIIAYPYSDFTHIIYSENHKTFITYSSGYENLGCYLNDNKHRYTFYHLGRNETFTGGNRKFFGPAADIFNRNLFNTYESNRHGESGVDIWGNVQSIADIDFDPELFRPPISDDTLYPNFPNPFNGVTRIAYELLAYHKVKLAIYDVLGREVRVLVNKNQEKGYYEVEFNAAGLASGIYFVRLEAFRTQIRKMVVIK